MIIRMRIRMHPYNSVRYNYTPHELAGEFTFTCDSLDEAQQFACHVMCECDVDNTMYDTYEEVDYALPSHHYSHEYVAQYIHSTEYALYPSLMTDIQPLIDRFYQSRKAHFDEMSSLGFPTDLNDRLLNLFLRSFEEDIFLAECVPDLEGNAMYSTEEAEALFQTLYAADQETDEF